MNGRGKAIEDEFCRREEGRMFHPELLSLWNRDREGEEDTVGDMLQS